MKELTLPSFKESTFYSEFKQEKKISWFYLLFAFLAGSFLCSLPFVSFIMNGYSTLLQDLYRGLLDKTLTQESFQAIYIALLNAISNSRANLLLSLFGEIEYLVAFAFLMVLLKESSFHIFGITKINSKDVKKILVACATCFLFFGLFIIFEMLFCGLTFEENTEWSHYFGILAMFGFLIQSSMEEFLIRGVFMTQLLCRSKSPYRAILFSSLFFAFMHMGNANTTPLAYINLFLFACLMGCSCFYFGSIYPACVFHFVWNAVEGLLCGFAVSGDSTSKGLLLSSYESNSALLTGGDFGPEGSILVTILLLALIILIGILQMKKEHKNSEEV